MPRAKSYIGLDVGGTNLKAGRLQADGSVADRRHDPVRIGTTRDLLDQLEAAVRELRTPETEAVGVGLPGIVDRHGRVRKAPNVPVLDGQFVGQELLRRTGLPSFIENDSNAAALAEAWLGAGRDVQNLLFVALGTGVGGGIVLDGQIWSGPAGYAGEIGHIQVEEGGAPCGCGSRGCVETFAGAAGWTRLAERALASDRPSVLRGKTLDPAAIAGAARDGDAVALAVVDEVARALGIGIAASLLLINVECVVVGGGVAQAGEVLTRPLSAHIRRRIFTDMFTEGMVRTATVGNDAGMIGAARVGMLGAARVVRA